MPPKVPQASGGEPHEGLLPDGSDDSFGLGWAILEYAMRRQHQHLRRLSEMGYPPVHRDALLIVSDVGSNTQVAAAGVDNKEMPKPDTVSSQLTNIRSLQHQYEPDGEADNEMDIEKGLSDETQPALLQRDSTGSSLPNPPPSQDAPMAGEEPGNTIDVDMDEPDQVPPLFDLSDSPLSEPPSSEEATTPDEEQESEQSNSLLSDADPSHQPPTAPNVFPATDAEKERYINNLRKLCASRMNGRVDKEEIDIPTGYQNGRVERSAADAKVAASSGGANKSCANIPKVHLLVG